MSFSVTFTPDALLDIEELETYLALRFSQTNATLYVQRLTAACERIGLAPYRGSRRDDVRPGIRSIGFEKRVAIVFEVEGKTVVILGVSYAGRQFASAGYENPFV